MSIILLFLTFPVFSSHTSVRKIYLGNGNDYSFTASNVCDGYFDMWEDPLIPNSQRNGIGRAIFQTPEKIRQAKRLIKTGKSYHIGWNYYNGLPAFGTRIYNITSFDCFPLGGQGGFCQSTLFTDAIGNSGTQFDGISHWYLDDINGNKVYFNNFFGSDVDTDTGILYLGIEHYPTFFTRSWLLDVPQYLGYDLLPKGHEITLHEILGTLDYQNIKIKSITKGDVILIYTGWATQFFDVGLSEEFYNVSYSPGINLDVFKLFYNRGVMIIGSDNPSVEFDPLGRDLPGHYFWLGCAGGMLQEALKLDEWIKDARNGKVNYKGAYVFEPTPNEGVCCSPGKPMVFV